MTFYYIHRKWSSKFECHTLLSKSATPDQSEIMYDVHELFGSTVLPLKELCLLEEEGAGLRLLFMRLMKFVIFELIRTLEMVASNLI
jgi:hypothetical protein